jgi:hypothetical protein
MSNENKKFDDSDYDKLDIVSIEINGEVRNENIIKFEDMKGKDRVTLNITATKSE